MGGRWLEAIEVLSEENRVHADAEREAELMRLRHRAFAELDPGAGPETLPEVEDRFPGVRGAPPEVTPDGLDADTLRSAIQHHGSLLVRGLVPPAAVERLHADVDHAFAAVADGRAGAPAEAWYLPLADDGIDSGVLDFDRTVGRTQGALLAADSPRAFFDIVETYRRAGVGRVLTDYFGEHPTLSARKTVLRRMHADHFYDALDGRGVDSGWHQDGAFLGPGVRTINLWLSLTDCGSDAPSLDLVARRIDRILPTGTEGAAFEWAASNTVVEDASAGDIVRPQFAAGDALFFDGFCVHQTGAAPSMTRPRYAIESWFFAPSTYPLEWIPLVF